MASPRWPSTTALVAFLWFVLPGSAQAQCPAWSGGLAAPGMDGAVTASLAFDDGSGPKLYATGEFQHAPGADAKGVARWDGNAWSQVGAGLDGNVYALASFDDGTGPKLAAGGYFRVPGGSPERSGRVALWNGSVWTELGSAFPADPAYGWTIVYSLAQFDDGAGPKLCAGGAFNGGSVRRWNGSTWAVLGGGLFNNDFDNIAIVDTLTVHDDGGTPVLYAGGSFSRTGSQSASGDLFNVARLSGSTWITVGAGLGNNYDQVTLKLVSFDTGSGTRLFAAGRLRIGNTNTQLAVWNGVAWTAIAGQPDGFVTALAGFDSSSGLLPGLYVGGSFAHAGGLVADDVAVWDGTNWQSIGGATQFNLVSALTAVDTGSGGKLFACSSNGVVERLDGAAWSIPQGGGGADATVSRLVAVDVPGEAHELFAHGDFSAIGGVHAARLARWDGAQWSEADMQGYNYLEPLSVLDLGTGPHLYARTSSGSGASPWRIVRRDGAAWTELPRLPTLGNGAPSAVAVFDAGSGPALYASGPYGLWRLDGASWTSMVGLSDQPINGLFAYDDGSGPALFLTGHFQSIGGVTCRGVARWNGATLDSLNGGTNPNADVYALRSYDDGNGLALYAAGTFSTMGGVPASCLARWNGAAWSGVGGGVQGTPCWVTTLCVHDDGSGVGPELVAGGHFTSVDGAPANSIARWNGSSWRTMDGGVTGINQLTGPYASAGTLAVFDDGGGHGADLFVGGSFLHAGAVDSAFIARVRGCGSFHSFCFGDGTGAACPCANYGLPGHGCKNSATVRGAELDATGLSLLAADSVVLTSTFENHNVTSVFLQGNQMVAPVFFGDGLRCTGGTLKRLYVANASANGAVSAPTGAMLSISARSAQLGDTIAAGTKRWYQVYYRDPSPTFCPDPPGSTFNVSNGVEILWQ